MELTKTEAAANTVAQLEEKLADVSARATELQTERRKLSFDANTAGGDARKRLDKLNAQSATIDLELENIKSAIDEGRSRLAAARRDDEAAGLRANALAVMALAE